MKAFKSFMGAHFGAVRMQLIYLIEGMHRIAHHVRKQCCGCRSIADCGNPTREEMEEAVRELGEDGDFEVRYIP